MLSNKADFEIEDLTINSGNHDEILRHWLVISMDR